MPGYWVYFVQHGLTIGLLLCRGGAGKEKLGCLLINGDGLICIASPRQEKTPDPFVSPLDSMLNSETQWRVAVK